MPRIQVFDDLENTLFTIIDATDAQGYAHFAKPKAYLPQDVSHKSKAAVRQVLETALHPHHLFVSRSKSWFDALDASRVVLDDGNWLVRFNAARLFFLPCEKPAEELAELRSLFEAMKSYFVANAQGERPAVIRVMNERDSHGRVYGSFKCLLGGAEPADFASSLQARIDASATLRHFQRQYALALGKVGRYSWCDLREENFFTTLERPWSNEFHKRWKAKNAPSEPALQGL